MKAISVTSQSRVRNTFRNTFFGAVMYVTKILLQFAVRAVFNRCFITEYLGLNGLYSNILNVLSLAELGVGNAIVYSMYKPIAENDTEKIKSLVALYRKLYWIIGTVITVIGLALIPALPYLIKDTPDVDINLNVIYVLYLAQTVIGYFFAYRRSLLFAYQRNDVESKVAFGVQVVLAAGQIIIMMVWQNYYAYAAAMAVSSALDAIIVFILSYKLYPAIRGKAIKTDKATVKEITKNTGALVCHKIGTAVVFSTDSIIISAFISLNILGVYSNYTLTISALTSAVNLIISAIRGSIGNLIATSDRERSYRVFNALHMLLQWFIGFLFVGIMICIQEFVVIIGGSLDKQLPYMTACFMAISFYLTESRLMANHFKECAGLFWNDRFKPLFEAGINLGLDILLVHFMGINGVILATIISTVAVPIWIEPYVLYKHYFKKNLALYFIRFAIYALVTAVAFGATFGICYWIPHGGVGWFVLRVAICLVVPNVVFYLAFFKTSDFAYLKEAFKSVFMRKSKKEVQQRVGQDCCLQDQAEKIELADVQNESAIESQEENL